MRLCARAVLEFVPPRTYTYAERINYTRVAVACMLHESSSDKIIDFS